MDQNRISLIYLLKVLLRFLRNFISRILSIQEGTDVNASIEGIKKDISFKGPTAWILMLSILIASIGLNVNSVAVIIGAMLISPLMGPILGIGLSLGTNDWNTLIRSLKNYGIAIGLSLFTSAIYFSLTPLDFVQSELLNRTKPTILDVLIALFGGFAGAIAGSRREKSNVVPGVAIATALMPPLCTAGYGIANLNAKFFLGAFYLFFINSVFIALSTYIVVRYLKFPKVQFIDEERTKKYRLWLAGFLIVTIIPSVLIFWNVIQETRFNIAAERLIAEKCQFKGSELISKKITYTDTVSIIDLYFMGDRVGNEKLQYLKDLLPEYRISGDEFWPATDRTDIIIHQERDESDLMQQKFAEMNQELRLDVLKDIYTKSEDLIKDKDQKIELLENELVKLRTMGMIPMDQLQKEIGFHYKYVRKFSFANAVEVTGSGDSLSLDTIPSLFVHFAPKTANSVKEAEIQKINDWVKIRFDKNNLRVMEY